MEPFALTAAGPPQGSPAGDPRPSPEADPRALALLAALHERQQGLERGAALAWERAAFAEAFADPEPGRRVRAFLGEVD